MTVQLGFDLRLGAAGRAELERAFEACAARGEFTAEHVYRECNAAVQEILSVKSNRNAIGNLFKRKSKTRRFKIVSVVPASHPAARSRLIPVWRVA